MIDMGLADRVIIGGIWAPGLKEREQQSTKIEVVRIRTILDRHRGNPVFKLLATLIFNVKSYFLFKKYPVKYLNCHSLWVLPLCVAIKKATGATLIYDAHELETEREGLVGYPQKFAKWLERRLIKHADKIIVVGDFIGNWYRSNYGIDNVYVVRNIPLQQYRVCGKPRLLKEFLQIPKDEILFIYQGVLSDARGVDVLLEVFSRAGKGKHIVFMGYGSAEGKIQEAAARFPNIHFHPPVKLADLTRYTASADVGVFFIERKTSLSYRFCMPNKFFEYMYAGIPILISDFPEMNSIISTHNTGWQVASNAAALSEFINNLTPEAIINKKPDTEFFSQHFSWEKEAVQLKQVFGPEA